MILVASKNKDFAEVVCEQVTSVLGFPCTVSASLDAVNHLDSGVKLVISDQQVAQSNVPLITPDRIPFRIGDLLGKVQFALQMALSEKPVALGKHYSISLRAKELLAHDSGKTTALTDKEVQLLIAIKDAGAAGLEKEMLLKTVWGFEPEVNTHTLETHVYRLRAKFRELSGKDEGIETSDGKYRLSA